MSPPSTSSLRRAEPLVVGAVAVSSGLAAMAAAGDPTALVGADAAWRFVLGAAVPLAAYRARSWSWILMSAVAALGSTGVPRLGSAVALVVSVVAVASGREHRLVGLMTGAAAVQGLLRLDLDRYHGDSALVVALAVVPVLVSAYRSIGPSSRRQVHRAGLLFLGVSLILGGAALAGAAAGYSPTQDGIEEARAGLESARDGDTEGAVAHFDQARAEFAAAHGWFDSWIVRPALAVPVVGQQMRALERAAGASAELSELAARTAAESDIESLRFEEGTIDIGRVTSMEDPLVEVEGALERSLGELRDAGSPWLLPQVADPIGTLTTELGTAHREAVLAVDGVRVAPGLLGVDGQRTYLVMFTTPSEARGLGGFVGSWAELHVDEGRVELGETVPSSEFGFLPGTEEEQEAEGRVLVGPEDYLARYARFEPEEYPQDITLSPDLPSVAEVAAGLYPQLTDSEVDGVIALDPYGLAGLLAISGPVQVEGLEEPLTTENAVDFLLVEQYSVFETEQEQEDVLAEVAEATLDALLDAPELPGPRQLVDTLGPLVDQDRLMVWTFESEEAEFLTEIGLDGSFARPDGDDFFSLVTQNGGHSKIDSFLERDISYEVEHDPATGALRASAEVRLRNTAPEEGLPDSVIGNTMDLPPGTNRMYFSFYSPHHLEEGSVDGAALPFEVHEELGWWVYSRYVEVPPGSEVVIRLELTGSLDPGNSYRLRIDHQPLVNDDRVSVDLHLPEGWVEESGGDPTGTLGSAGGVQLEEDVSVEVGIEPA